MPNLNVGLVLAVMLGAGDAFGVSTGVGAGRGAITEIDCNQYDSQASGYVSVYNNATDFTATSHTYANDFAYFKKVYCGTSNTVQTAHCYIVTRDGSPKSKVVVADCAQGMTAKIYFVQSGSALVAGTLTSLPTSYDTYVSFVAACDQCSGTTTGTWTATGAPTGYQIRTDTTKSSKFCNICNTSTSSVFRCVSGYYGPTNQASPTGCTKCTTSSAITATSTPGSNTTVSSCSFRCAAGYYGTATSAAAGCATCPSDATCAGGNGSTFVCNAGYYNTLNTFGSDYGCQPCIANTAVCDNTGIKCKAGYYGVRVGGVAVMQECKQCPNTSYNATVTDKSGETVYNVSGNTDGAGAMDITECFDNSGAGYYFQKDTVGFWQYDGDCHYSN